MMLDWQGRVAECTGANIFFAAGGALHTPIADCFLDGITRRTVIDLARRRGIEVIERRIMPEDLPISTNASSPAPGQRSRPSPKSVPISSCRPRSHARSSKIIRTKCGRSSRRRNLGAVEELDPLIVRLDRHLECCNIERLIDALDEFEGWPERFGAFA